MIAFQRPGDSFAVLAAREGDVAATDPSAAVIPGLPRGRRDNFSRSIFAQPYSSTPDHQPPCQKKAGQNMINQRNDAVS